jgi:hypothetical protein
MSSPQGYPQGDALRAEVAAFGRQAAEDFRRIGEAAQRLVAAFAEMREKLEARGRG